MSKHTPGPWSHDSRFIYSAPASGLPARYNHGACLVLARAGNDSTPADVALIAAAPDLLDALKRIVYTYTPRDDYEKQSYSLACDLIASLQGE